MPDHDDPLPGLRDVDVRPLPAAEVRARGDRLRRRRTTLTVLGAAASVALVAGVVGVVTSPGGQVQPSPAPAITSPSPTTSQAAAAGQIPDDFPLTAGVPEHEGLVVEHDLGATHRGLRPRGAERSGPGRDARAGRAAEDRGARAPGLRVGRRRPRGGGRRAGGRPDRGLPRRPSGLQARPVHRRRVVLRLHRRQRKPGPARHRRPCAPVRRHGRGPRGRGWSTRTRCSSRSSRR